MGVVCTWMLTRQFTLRSCREGTAVPIAPHSWWRLSSFSAPVYGLANEAGCTAGLHQLSTASVCVCKWPFFSEVPGMRVPSRACCYCGIESSFRHTPQFLAQAASAGAAGPAAQVGIQLALSIFLCERFEQGLTR